jgi:ADP-heptose:LPS heptosyltransferase
MKRFLVIQTAFIGDVVLALPVAQRLHTLHPGCEVHFVVRKGNESLVANHPWIQHIWIWDKRQDKIRNLFRLARKLRKLKFDAVYNLHRFGSSGFLTWRMKAAEKIGFDKNPWKNPS